MFVYVDVENMRTSFSLDIIWPHPYTMNTFQKMFFQKSVFQLKSVEFRFKTKFSERPSVNPCVLELNRLFGYGKIGLHLKTSVTCMCSS